MKRCMVCLIVFAAIATVPAIAAGDFSFAWGGGVYTAFDTSGAPADAGVGLLMNLRLGVHGALLWNPGGTFVLGGEVGAATGIMGVGYGAFLEVPVRVVAIFGLGPVALEPFAGALLFVNPFGPDLITPCVEAGIRCMFGFVSGFFLEASYVAGPVSLIKFGVGGQLSR